MDDPREQLVAERARVEARLGHLERQRAEIVQIVQLDVPDDEHDPDGATLAWEREQLTALMEAERQRLAAVDQALARVGQGVYGICTSCGQPIPAGRLEARPFAVHCLACAG